MTMAHQGESQLSLNSSNRDYSPPAETTTDTNDNIILGENYAPALETEHANSEQAPAFSLDPLFDDYVAALRNPKLEHTYESGLERVKPSKANPSGSPKILFTTISREEILEKKMEDLHLYAKGSLSNGTIEFDVSILPKSGPITYDTICEAYVDNGIARAIARAEQPAHITIGQGDSEADSKFAEVLRSGIKDLGSVAIYAIKSTVAIISGPISTSRNLTSSFASNERIREATPGQPADPKNLTGDALTVTLSTLKY